MKKIPVQKFEVPESFFQLLLNSYPVNISTMESIIDRVHKQYPFVSKSEITLVTKYFFETVREQLFRGDTLNVRSLFNKTKLVVFYKTINRKLIPAVKIRTTIPKELR